MMLYVEYHFWVMTKYDQEGYDTHGSDRGLTSDACAT